MLSKRSTYAIRVMVDMAEHNGLEINIPTKDLSERLNIPKKYLESIMTILSKNNLVDALGGKGGGYRLNRIPEQYTLFDILKVTEDTLAPVDCLKENAKPCPLANNCRTLNTWKKLYEMNNEFYSSIRISDLTGSDEIDYYI